MTKLRLAIYCSCLALLLASPVTGQEPAAEQVEAIHGFDVDLLAQTWARQSAFRTQYGEREGRAKLDQFLASQGSSRSDFDTAFAAWYERFKADKSGELEASFHLLSSKYSQELNFGDVPDQSADQREGVTLDTYAKIVVEMTRPAEGGGEPDVDAIAKRHGLDGKEHFDRVNEAWIAAMREDTTHALMQQYGQLYQQHAGPVYEREQQQRLASALANTPRPKSPPPPPKEPPTFDEQYAALAADVPSERWRAVRPVTFACWRWSDLGKRQRQQDPRRSRCESGALKPAVVPLMIEALDHGDRDSLSAALVAIDHVDDLDLMTPELSAALSRALTRAESEAEAAEQAFAKVQDRAVPERVTLRSQLDFYRRAASELRSTLDGD